MCVLAWCRCVALASLALATLALLVRDHLLDPDQLKLYHHQLVYCHASLHIPLKSFNRTMSGRTVRVTVQCFNPDCEELGISFTTLLDSESSTRLTNVTEHCGPPQRAHFLNALAALNVTIFSKLDLVHYRDNTIYAPFAGVDPLAKDTINGSLSLGESRLSPALRQLSIYGVRSRPDVLRHLPTTLETLDLTHTGLARVHLDTLPRLHTLYLEEDFTVDVNVSAAHALQDLYIHMPNIAVPDDALPPSLRYIQYFGWNDTHATPLTRCDHLNSLNITGVINNLTLSLPAAWVSRCGKLTQLYIEDVPLRTLPATLLARAAELREFKCVRCELTELPLGLFKDTRQLLRVNMSFNQIKSVPRGLFKHVVSLKVLDLSHNQLTSAVAALLADVFSLQVLRLNNNRRLGELCDGLNATRIYHYYIQKHELSELYLEHTNITRVCRIVRRNLPRLKQVYADPIAFDNLTYTDLQYEDCMYHECTVYLGNGGEFSLLYTREEYEAVPTRNAPRDSYQAIINIGGTLRCDCETYWAALAFHKNEHYVRTTGLKCGDTELSVVDVDTLTCDASPQCAPLRLPAHCTCGARPDYQHGAVVIVTCERANLTALPRLPPANHKWRLHLAHNHISTVHAADVSRDIVELDLRNNSIRYIDSEAAVMLADIPLQLAGNHQVECGCEAFDMLTALLNISSQLQDADKVTCMDGKRMTEASRVPCATITGPTVAGLVVFLGFSLALVSLLAQPKIRQHLKTMLISMGWLPPPPEPKDDRHRRFDVFVSYAHEDEQFVVEQLAHQLERGPRPYRLCMHQRDWAPGEWIPAQIAASVRSSRRTLAVVSQHYVRSAWARAEFREAHAATLQDPVPRLVVLLLDDPASLPLDPELRAYVRQNTYVRWGDPWFWEKLRQALPPPRAVRRDEDETAVAAPSAPSEPSAPSSAP